jgi:signal transduction histidine kinase
LTGRPPSHYRGLNRFAALRPTGDTVPRLIVIKGADEGKQFELSGAQLSIGRDAANKVRLHDTEVSRRHAELHRVADGYRVLDRGSANGTFVNGRQVSDVQLQPGDQVQVGQTVLVYSAGREMPTPSPLALAERIAFSRQEIDLPSAIVKTIGEQEGGRILARPEKMEAAWLKANLGILYEAIHAASHILDLDQLLERLLELIFRALDADRGCVLLRCAPEGAERGHDTPPCPDELEPKALRWRADQDREEKIPISRTLIEYVLHEKQGLLVNDAARDERFQAAQSIVRFGIREIICVPMRGRHETIGLLYLDSRTVSRDNKLPAIARFNADHLSLAIALAHQAALAVEETRHYQALVQAERLAAVGQTIAALSHHIKNILQGLRSGGDILKMGLSGKDEVLLQQGWKIIEKNQGKVYDLVMDMLSYSKEREPAVEPTDLGQVAADVVELLAPRAQERGVALELVPPEPLGRVPCDPEGIHRALLNIVGNALDAVEDVEAPRARVRLTRSDDGAWARLEVEDNGVGIPPDKVNEVFRPFVSTKGSRGTGLGLAVSRKILREHGGDIEVRSAPGQGSTFTLLLPLGTPPAPALDQTMIPLRPPADEE